MTIQFSIIIPCYNVQSLVVQTLDSVKDQTYPYFEVIAINDGSTDQTLAALEEYRAKGYYDLKIITQENRGLGGARNTGIRNANYDYVAFLDADDLWYPMKLMKMKDIFEKHRGVDLVCHDEDVIRKGKRLKVNRYGPHDTYDDLLFKGNCLSGSAVAVKMSQLLEVGMFSEDRAIHGIEDYDLWMKLAKNGAMFYYLHEILGAYVLHEANMTAEVDSFFQRSYCLLNRHLEDYQQKNILFGIRSRIRQGASYRTYSRQLLSSGNFPKARQLAIKALSHNPCSYKNIILFLGALMHVKI